MPTSITVRKSDYVIQIVDINSYIEWQTVKIQISWLLHKPTDQDLHYLQRQGISGSAGQGLICLLISMSTYTENEPAHDKTYNKTCDQRRLRSAWESSRIACALYSLQDIQRGINENLCCTERMHRLIWVFASHTGLIVGFVVRWLKSYIYFYSNRFSTMFLLYEQRHRKRAVIAYANSKSVHLRNLSRTTLFAQVSSRPWEKSAKELDIAKGVGVGAGEACALKVIRRKVRRAFFSRRSSYEGMFISVSFVFENKYSL